jgi:hypothetical protein
MDGSARTASMSLVARPPARAGSFLLDHFTTLEFYAKLPYQVERHVMRMRRHFQPILDSMPSRIAPSSFGPHAPAIVAGAPSQLAVATPPRVMVIALDSADDNTSYPIIIAPVSPHPPSTLPC